MVHRPAFIGLPSGIGLVVSNMIGAGVFLSAGFMAQEMRPVAILAAWAAGAALAMCGGIAYGALAARIPRSGGEYRFLSELLHPAAGFLAGWASLLVGFAAPVAVNGLAIGAFLGTLVAHAPDPRLTGTVVVVALTFLHAVRLDVSKGAQDALVALKLLGVGAFVAGGLALGELHLPDWTPPAEPASPIGPFLRNQFWIAFAFSGWNAAIYAASEFRDPARTVPRAMWIGTAIVSALYLAVNFVLLANLVPDELAVVLSSDTDRITLGHLVADKLLGPGGAAAMSLFVIVALTSATSAMTMIGPRVYAEMAEDGFLPSWMAGRPAPVGAIVLQAAVALVMLHTHTVLEMVQSVSAALMIFTGLSIATLFGLARSDTPPAPLALGAGAIYLLVVGLILYEGFAAAPHLLGWVALIAGLGLGGYALARRRAGGAT